LTDLQPRVFDDKCVPTVATPAGERTIQMAARFVTERASSPEALAQTSDDSQELFIGGRQAMTIGGTSRVASIRVRFTQGLSEYTGDGGLKEAWKDVIDVLRYAAIAGIDHVDNSVNLVTTQGGGGY
jgi:hypothetical protein